VPISLSYTTPTHPEVEHGAHFLILYYPHPPGGGARCPFPYPILPSPARSDRGWSGVATGRLVVSQNTVLCERVKLPCDSWWCLNTRP
jgi:hypothetical protein